MLHKQPQDSRNIDIQRNYALVIGNNNTNTSLKSTERWSLKSRKICVRIFPVQFRIRADCRINVCRNILWRVNNSSNQDRIECFVRMKTKNIIFLSSLLRNHSHNHRRTRAKTPHANNVDSPGGGGGAPSENASVPRKQNARALHQGALKYSFAGASLFRGVRKGGKKKQITTHDDSFVIGTCAVYMAV